MEVMVLLSASRQSSQTATSALTFNVQNILWTESSDFGILLKLLPPNGGGFCISKHATAVPKGIRRVARLLRVSLRGSMNVVLI